ncbi:MAG TPA: hypothetical protein VEP68_10605 [Anaeromyxobacteraceae bacterium]|nr:hypothetical protein [Anaeromyxobacteraceae bacterium]
MTRTYLPRFYLEGFADPDGDGSTLWVYRAPIGEWKRASPVEGPSADRWFNRIDDPALAEGSALDAPLEAVSAAAARVLRDRLPAREPFPAADREAAASFFALLGIRLAPRLEGLDLNEAESGHRTLAGLLAEMGWVFWEAEAPFHFVTSSSPFLVAFPRREEDQFFTLDLRTPTTEITLPLTSRVALHATWKRGGELWRRVSEDALLEINFRTCQRARKFLVSPRPAVPG